MNGPGAVLAAGLALLAAAGLADLALGARRARVRAAVYLIGAAAAACLAGAGAAAVAGHFARLGTSGLAGWLGPGSAGRPAGGLNPGGLTTGGLNPGGLTTGGLNPGGLNPGGLNPGGLALSSTGLVADRLSGLFLLIAFGAAVPVLLACASWAGRPGPARRPGLGAACALTLGAVALVLTAADAFTALLGWELLTVAFYLLAGFERERPGRASAGLITLVFGKLSGAALLVGLLLLAVKSGSLDLASFGSVPGGAARSAAQALLITGFAVKVGLVPFQVWLPRGYAAAPGPARAIMAGVAVNVGFYGLWRTLALLGAPPGWLIGVLLVLAGLTALLGIAHAAVQPSLQRVIAYSSVENSGLILAGYGVALTGAAVHDVRLAAAGLLAATLQIITHTAAKSLLFTASAVVAPGADDLDGLRGSARRLPWSGTGLAIGSLTLAGLPLTAGFASEWFLLEALMQQFRVPGLGFRLVLAVAGAAVALTAGFAGVTFVRLTGLVALGPPPAGQDAGGPGADGRDYGGPEAGGRDHGGPEAGGREYGVLGRAAIVVLATACLAVAALLPLVIRVVAAGLAPVVPAAVTLGARKSPWVLQPVFSGFSVLSPSWLWIVMPLLALAVLGVTWLASGTRMIRVRRVPAWRSATAGVDGADSYTASGFANPTRRILAAVLHTTAELRPLPAAPGPVRTGPGAGVDPSAAAGLSAGTDPSTADGVSAADGQGKPGGSGLRLGYTSDVIEVTEAYLYRPALRPVRGLVRAVKRLQSGRLDAYLAYMLIALIAVLALVTALT